MDELKEIRDDIKELLQRSAVHNELLRTHEARSLALQKGQELLDVRIKPLETQAHSINMILKALGVILTGSAGGALIAGLISHFFR